MISGSFCKVSFQQINLNSHQQLKEFLYTQGWIPTSFTEKGSPQLTEDSYDSIKGELGQLIAKRAVLKHRAQTIFNLNKKGELKGWLNVARADGRIEAGAISNGTNTGRKMHRGLVNVPKPKDYGLWPSDVQLRSLIIAPKGRKLMGIDADALEARIEAHSCMPYRGGEEYAKELIEGDVHSSTAHKNRAMTDSEYSFFYEHKVEKKPLQTEQDELEYKRLEVIRDFWKSPRYALSYGSGIPGIIDTIGLTAPKGCTKRCWNCPKPRYNTCEGARVFNGFWDSNTALKGFREAITKYWKTTRGKKYIKGIDGRKIWVRSEHSIVNTYFQSSGSITVKVAMLFMDKWCRQRGLKSQQVMDFHDEYSYEVYKGEEDIIMELAARSFIKASEYLKLRVVVTGTPEIADNWQQIH